MNIISAIILISIILLIILIKYFKYIKKQKEIELYSIKYNIYDIAQYIIRIANKHKRKISAIKVNCIMIILYKRYLKKYKIKLFNDYKLKEIDYKGIKLTLIPQIVEYLNNCIINTLTYNQLIDLDDDILKYQICNLIKLNVTHLYLKAIFETNN